MTPAKRDQLMQGQTGIAKKIYECVPIMEPWNEVKIMQHLQRSTGSTPDGRVFQGCLKTLRDSGLIKQTAAKCFQRVSVEQKQPTMEPKMTLVVPAQEQPKPATEVKKQSAIELLGELAGEVMGIAAHMQRLAARVEDVALAIEQEREATSEELAKARQLKTLLQSL